MKRVQTQVTLRVAEARLRSYRDTHGIGPHPAAVLGRSHLARRPIHQTAGNKDAK
jgi:hypothetical protein